MQHFAVRLPDATGNRHRAIVSKATLRVVFLRAFYYSAWIYRVSSKGVQRNRAALFLA